MPYVAWAVVAAASLGVDVALVYDTPGVYVFDHLLGHFAGPIYDEAVGVELRHAAFRAISIARLLPLVLLLVLLYDPVMVEASTWKLGRPRVLATLVLMALVGGVTWYVEPRLGLRSSEAHIVSASPSNTRPHPIANSVSPTKATPASGIQ